MKKNLLYILFIPLLVLLLSCKKDKSIKAGVVNIHVRVQHHDEPIPNSTVYIKNNTLIFPGKDSSLYDSFIITDAHGYVLMPGIGNGKKEYILYAKGVDPAWDSTHTTPVWGFQPVLIDTRPGEDKEISIIIPVSE